MPSWTLDKKRYDVDGVEINPGDILQSIDLQYNIKYFVCFCHEGSNYIEVVDLNNNNIGMCTLSCYPSKFGNSNVKNIGNYKLHLEILKIDDLEYYFG